jgi:NTP pyrophosphatase (non-canonical NTP hydrolase)
MTNTGELLRNYQSAIKGSDRLPADVEPVVLGLAGEVGSILATAKKLVREKASYLDFRENLKEEFGDTLWYLSALCQRVNIALENVLLPRDLGPIDKNRSLLDLHSACAEAVSGPSSKEALKLFGQRYCNALRVFGFSIDEIAEVNAKKVRGAFLPLQVDALPEFDRGCEPDEQLPNEFRFHVVQRASGKAHMSLNGVFVGDPLLDNVAQPDGYRFHDVFHLANAAVLHWSPVIRALLKRKRKSNSEVDNTQDSGRAIVVEEGLATWLFQRAGPLGYFENIDSVPYGILKTIQEFVVPYEVAACPPSAWERAILQGYRAFRELRRKERGFLVGSRIARTIEFVEE